MKIEGSLTSRMSGTLALPPNASHLARVALAAEPASCEGSCV
jgi:hypothetical protein